MEYFETKPSSIEQTCSPLAKGIITIFDSTIENIYKLSLISLLKDIHISKDFDIPVTFEAVLEFFYGVTKDSSDEDCLIFIDLISNISNKDWIFLENVRKETPMFDFYNYFRKLRDVVEHKLSMPLKLWRQAKKDATHFPKVYGNLLKELDDVRHTVEKARLLRDKLMPEQAAKGKKMKMISAAEDFKSLHPFFIKANSEEHLQSLTSFKEKKLQLLKEVEKTAEENFEKTAVKFRKEIQNIIEETIKTKSFTEWLEKEYNAKMKYYEMKLKEEWKEFSSEMEISRNLSRVYREKNAIYLEITKEKLDRQRMNMRTTAAIVIQAYCRGFLLRRRQRGDFIL